MSSNWSQNRKGLRRALSENLGISGTRNVAAWVVAGTLAYYLWVKPQQKAEQFRQEELARKREWAKTKGLEEVDRVRPKPDPQTAGLIRAHSRPKDD